MHQVISTVFVAPPAAQQLHTFAIPLRKHLVKRLQKLRTSPHPPGLTKLDGMDHLYRVREGDYRILYAIRERELIILAVKSRTRREDRRTEI